jgi:hypothetical protein
MIDHGGPGKAFLVFTIKRRKTGTKEKKANREKREDMN